MVVELTFSRLRIAAIVALALLACVFIIDGIATTRIATQRSHQNHAMGQLREIGSAIGDYIHDHKEPPAPATELNTEGWTFLPVQDIEVFLVPTYLPALPTTDPWGYPYLYGLHRGTASFCVLSTGKDGIRDSSIVPSKHNGTSCFESDIIWSGYSFVQLPKGKQQFCGQK
jgi:hypothetical protein